MTGGGKIVAFIEAYCKIPKGAQVGQAMKFQMQFILDVYDNPHGTSRAYLGVARKNGKFISDCRCRAGSYGWARGQAK